MSGKLAVIVASVAGALAFVGGVWAGEANARLHPKTMENLSAAMHGEAFAHAKYLLFAQHARLYGHPEIADEFQKAATVERLQHFAEAADLTGLVGTEADNPRDAIRGESYEVDTMYRRFAEEARAVGDTAAAERFEEIRRDEMQHRDAFKATLAHLEHGAAPAVQ